MTQPTSKYESRALESILEPRLSYLEMYLLQI